MSPKVVDKKEKKDQIIVAAIQVFAKKGFSKTTISDIANAAGIGKGTIYEYFSNKEEIVHQAFIFFVREMEWNFQEILIKKVSAKEKLDVVFQGFYNFLDAQSGEFLELMFDFWAEGIRSKKDKGILLNEMNMFYNAYREIFADIIIQGMGDGSFKKDINPRSLASLIVGALDGVLVQWLLDKNAIDYQDIVKTLSSTVLNGILPRNSK